MDSSQRLHQQPQPQPQPPLPKPQHAALEEGSEEEEEDSPDDDDQVAFAAHAAAQALSDNDNAAAAVLGDDVDVDALAKAVEDASDEDDDDESTGFQQPHHHPPPTTTTTTSHHPGAPPGNNGYAAAAASSSNNQQQHIVGFPPPSTVKHTHGALSVPSAVAGIANGLYQQQQQQQQQHPQLPIPAIIEHPICCICGQGNEEGRPILRFLPVLHEVGAARAAPAVVTFGQDILLHIFCGKTASILPTVNRPDLEILTKAGLKNKHGIGPEVNAALARTRSAIVLVVEPEEDDEDEQGKNAKSSSSVTSAASNKDKQYYLVREFEAHLASIRHTHLAFDVNGVASVLPPGTPVVVGGVDPFAVGQSDLVAAALGDPAAFDDAVVDVVTGGMVEYAIPQPEAPKIPPIKARAGQVQKPSKRYSNTNNNQHQQPPPPPLAAAAANVGPTLLEQHHDLLIPYGAELLADGKIKCPCGGTHLPPTQQRGAQSWRNHIMTKRHQKWMEEHGLVGTV